ncbi:MAG: GT4 family glycosyltransferase PelF [Candidatus Bathyarchaeia archaeon]
MRLSILLATEGTYPFHAGGVSTWCDALTRNLPEFDFTLLSVMMHPYLKRQYSLPPNIRFHLKIPLWGIEEPGEFSYLPLADYLKRRWDLSERVIETDLVPFIYQFFTEALKQDPDPEKLGAALVRIHNYFQQYDYHQSMRSRPVWNAFQEVARSSHPLVSELVDALRLVYRFFIVLHFPIPVTDITHSAAAAFCGLPCVIARIQRGTPYLLTEHGVYLREQYLNMRKHIASDYVRWFLYRLVGAIVRLNYHYSDQISPVCSFNKRWELWHGADPKRLKVIYNGVDPERFKPTEERNVRPVVVNIGLIFPLKGQLDLIEAAAIVRQQHSEVEFRFYGSPSDQSYYERCLKRVGELSLESVVKFEGKTNEPWRVYSEASLVAFSSISEGFPYVVIEAMLSGTAIVATDVGGVREALGGAGILVRPRHPEEMATAINYLLEDPERRRNLGSKAGQRALALFTQEKFLQEYRESYYRLACVKV